MSNPKHITRNKQTAIRSVNYNKTMRANVMYYILNDKSDLYLMGKVR